MKELCIGGHTVHASEDESGLGLIGISANRVDGLDQARERLGRDWAQDLFNQGCEVSRTRAIHYARNKPD